MERTTTLHKFTVYVWGFNDMANSQIDEAADAISDQRFDLCIKPFHEMSIEIGDIHDDHPLNKGPSKETYELFMDPKLKELFDRKISAERELHEYMMEKGLNK